MPVTSTVYSEAILEAKRLREVAEANAKNALIEVVAPRVRQMIERQLLGESIDDLDEDILASVADDAAAKAVEDEPATTPTGPEKTSSTGDGEKEEILKDALKGKDVVLTIEAANALKALSGETSLPDRSSKLKRRVAFIRELQETSVKSKSPGASKIVDNMLRKSLAEARSLEETAIRIGKDPSGVDSAWASDLMGTRREIDEMAARKKTIRESAEEMLEVDIPGLDDPGEVGPPMEDETVDSEVDSDDVQIPADLAQELLATLEAEMAAGEEVEVEDSEEMEATDEGSEDSEGDLDDDDMVDIDEGMLRRELARMREASIREEKASKKVAMIDPKASSFGGGKVEREVFVDSDDSDLNVMEAKHLRQELVKEGRKNRALRKQLTGLQTVMGKFREQLEQMNLFNAKLLYVNKLMTNEGVTAKQKQVIVESLDKAKTLREVKLLYKTLSTSLVREKPKARGQVTESVAVRAGSASRPAQTGSTTGEARDTQLDRWATLAGIKSK